MYFINRSYKLDEKTRASIILIEVDFPQYSSYVMEMELRHDDACRYFRFFSMNFFVHLSLFSIQQRYCQGFFLCVCQLVIDIITIMKIETLPKFG